MRRVGGKSSADEYELHRLTVLAMLGKRFPRLDEDERLSIYHDAWARVLGKRERGEKIHSLKAYLLATTAAEALHVLSRGRVPTPVGPDDPRLTALSDDAPPVDEQVVDRDQARIARDLLDTLDRRQRDVLKLRWDLQLSASEVRAALGLSERQYKRLAEEGAVAIAKRVEELQSGEWSQRTRSLLVACLVEVTRDGQRRVGIASRRQREEAQRLLESDPHVAALYAEVRRSVRGAAALLPLPVLAFDRPDGSLARLAELASEVRGQLSNAVEGAKSQATSLYVRAADPALISGGPRPTTAVVAVSGALALGGGAYATHEITEPTKPSTPTAVSSPTPIPPAMSQAPLPPPNPTLPAPKPSKPNTTPAPTPNPTQPPAPTPPPTPTPQPAAPAPPQPTQPNTEFGFEN
jgi:DNA-directed RNA polymerase specialized sigma24 family protein